MCVYIYVCIHRPHIFFFYLYVYGHLGCFHTLATVNNAAMNTEGHVSFLISVFVLFRYIPRSRIVGSYGVLPKAIYADSMQFLSKYQWHFSQN